MFSRPYKLSVLSGLNIFPGKKKAQWQQNKSKFLITFCSNNKQDYCLWTVWLNAAGGGVSHSSHLYFSVKEMICDCKVNQTRKVSCYDRISKTFLSNYLTTVKKKHVSRLHLNKCSVSHFGLDSSLLFIVHFRADSAIMWHQNGA